MMPVPEEIYIKFVPQAADKSLPKPIWARDRTEEVHRYCQSSCPRMTQVLRINLTRTLTPAQIYNNGRTVQEDSAGLAEGHRSYNEPIVPHTKNLELLKSSLVLQCLRTQSE